MHPSKSKKCPCLAAEGAVELSVGLANLDEALAPADEGHDGAEHVAGVEWRHLQLGLGDGDEKLERLPPRQAEFGGVDDVERALVALGTVLFFPKHISARRKIELLKKIL